MTLLDRFKSSNIVIKLIAVNALVFLIVNILLGVWAMSGDFNLNEATESLRLGVSADMKLLLYRPWTIVTYMFTHYDFMHIFVNMLILFFLGRIFLYLTNPRKFLSMYVMGGLAGFLFYVIGFNFFPALNVDNTHMIGASASVMAIVLAAATYSPNYTVNLIIFGPVKLWLIGVLYVLADIAAIKYFDNTGGHLAHLGGAAYGFLWARQMKQGKNIGAWMERWLDRLANLFKGGGKTRMKVVKNQRRGGKTDEEYIMEKRNNQARVDSILDKISKSGYDSLTKDEKDFLFKQGEN